LTNPILIDLDKPHVNQKHIKNTARRFNVLNCGRRFGKTKLGEDLTFTPAVEKGLPVSWYSPNYKDMAEVWRDLKRIYAPLIVDKSEVEKRLELITGGTIELWSLDNPDSSRGRKYCRIVVDEAAKVKKLEEAWTQTIRPTLADYQGDAYFLSTPKGLNYFHTLWSLANDRDDWMRWKYSTYDNPFIPTSEIDAMRDELPERVFSQEILAEFLEDGAYFQGVDQAAIITDKESYLAHQGHSIFMAVDWAISNDYTVVTVGCRDCCKVVDWERFNQIDFTYQRERLYQMAKRWPQLLGCLPERNSIGQPNIEIIRNRVPVMTGPDGKPGFNTSATTKPELIQRLASAFEHEGFKVPKVAADELRVYEVEMTMTNKLRFGAPEGLHDDWVISLALLWRAMSKATHLPNTQPTQRSKWNEYDGDGSRWKKY